MFHLNSLWSQKWVSFLFEAFDKIVFSFSLSLSISFPQLALDSRALGGDKRNWMGIFFSLFLLIKQHMFLDLFYKVFLEPR